MEKTAAMDGKQSVDFMTSVIPELHLRLRREELQGDPKKIITVIVDFTKGILKAKDWRRVYWTMQVMGYVYGRADAELRASIGSLFVGAFDNFQKICDQMEWQHVQQRIPLLLLKPRVTNLKRR